MEIHPLVVGKKSKGFSLFDDLVLALEKNGVRIEDGDVLAISSKYVARSQGRTISLKNVHIHHDGRAVAEKLHMREEFAEVVQRESDTILGGIPGFAMALVDNILAPNAGIDKSNAGGGIVLYPSEPYETSEGLKRSIFLKFQVNAGVIIIDSRLMPARAGTVGVAIGCAGIEPINDMRAQKDLDGSPLKVTMQSVADGLATAANHGMGEGLESRPYVIIKGSDAKMTTRRILSSESAVAHDACVYMRGLGQSSFK